MDKPAQIIAMQHKIRHDCAVIVRLSMDMGNTIHNLDLAKVNKQLRDIKQLLSVIQKNALYIQTVKGGKL